MIPLSEDFIDSLKNIPSVDRAALAAALDTPPSVSIRRNRRKSAVCPDVATTDGLTTAPVPWCEEGIYLNPRPVFTLDPMLHGGAYYVQDASSMIYQQVADRLCSVLAEEGISEHPLTLDFCAAPGGKTTSLINALPDGSTIVANEFVAARGKILRENLEKWGYPYVITTGCDSSRYAALPEMFDIIAIDAPCSGEGMMRKDEDARRQWSKSLVANCASLQREILSDLVGTLRPGGFLIYSTCTFNTSEDEENSLFISEQLGLEPVAIDSLNLSGIEKAGRAVLPGVEGLRFMPHLTQGEGLYISVFRRPIGCHTEPEPRTPGKKSRNKNRSQNPELTEAMRMELKGWFDPKISPRFELSDTMITMLPESAAEVADMLRRYGVKVTGGGLPVAEIKGRIPKAEVVPDSRLALNQAMNPTAFPTAPLSKEDALRFLRRESFPLDGNIPKGYVIATYQGLPLGIMKNLGNRANNLFPTAWKIRL